MLTVNENKPSVKPALSWLAVTAVRCHAPEIVTPHKLVSLRRRHDTGPGALAHQGTSLSQASGQHVK